MKQFIEDYEDGAEDYADTAVSIFRRILSGANTFKIRFHDIFPRTYLAGWYAPWCDGFLSKKPIRHEDIPTFYCPGTEMVSFYQLAAVEEYGHIPKTSDFDLDFEYDDAEMEAMDIDDEAHYEDLDSGSSEHENDYGIIYEDSFSMVAAQIIDIHNDEIRVALGNECEPLVDMYYQRVLFVSDLMLQHMVVRELTTYGRSDRFVQLHDELSSILKNDANFMKNVSSFKAKVMFTLYPTLSCGEVTPDEKYRLIMCFLRNYLIGNVLDHYKLHTNYSYYTYYPISIIEYLRGETLLSDVQKNLRVEAMIDGPKESIVIDEDMLFYRDSRNGLVVGTNPMLPMLLTWAELYPVIVIAKATGFTAKCLIMQRDYPQLKYTLVKPHMGEVIDITPQSPTHDALWCVEHGDVRMFRSAEEIAVVLAFVFKATLPCGSITWHPAPDEDRGFQDFVGPIELKLVGKSVSRPTKRVQVMRFSDVPKDTCDTFINPMYEVITDDSGRRRRVFGGYSTPYIQIPDEIMLSVARVLDDLGGRDRDDQG